MNERIKLLAEQAVTEKLSLDEFIAALKKEPHDFYGFRRCELEKFAELIVRECVSVMKSTVDESIDFDRKLDETSSWIESDIKRHLGVE